MSSPDVFYFTFNSPYSFVLPIEMLINLVPKRKKILFRYRLRHRCWDRRQKEQTHPNGNHLRGILNHNWVLPKLYLGERRVNPNIYPKQ